MQDLLIYRHSELCCVCMYQLVRSLVLDMAVLCCKYFTILVMVEKKDKHVQVYHILFLYGQRSGCPDGAAAHIAQELMLKAGCCLPQVSPSQRGSQCFPFVLLLNDPSLHV